jgi:hypothetical protein
MLGGARLPLYFQCTYIFIFSRRGAGVPGCVKQRGWAAGLRHARAVLHRARLRHHRARRAGVGEAVGVGRGARARGSKRRGARPFTEPALHRTVGKARTVTQNRKVLACLGLGCGCTFRAGIRHARAVLHRARLRHHRARRAGVREAVGAGRGFMAEVRSASLHITGSSQNRHIALYTA